MFIQYPADWHTSSTSQAIMEMSRLAVYICFRESHSDYDDNNDDVAEIADSSSDEESEGYVVQNIKALFE